MLLADATASDARLDHLMSMIGFGRDAEVSVPRVSLLSSSQAVLQLLEKEGELLNYDYLVDIPAHGVWPRVRGECNIHGLRRNGSPHSLYARHGQCWLERWEGNEDGLGRAVERLDLRQQTALMLDADVEVKIRKKWRGVPPWREGFTRLIKLLRSCPTDLVEVSNPVR
jgi:hypothetical protein